MTKKKLQKIDNRLQIVMTIIQFYVFNTLNNVYSQTL